MMKNFFKKSMLITGFIILFSVTIFSLTQTTSLFYLNVTDSFNTVNFEENANNASQTSWNETWQGTSNKTFYITIPKNSTVNFMNINITGFNITDYTSFTIDDTEDSAGYTSGITNPTNAYDDNWGTFAIGNAEPNGLWVYYTIPSGIGSARFEINYSADWGVDGGVWDGAKFWLYGTGWDTGANSIMMGTLDVITNVSWVAPISALNGSELRINSSLSNAGPWWKYYDSRVFWYLLDYPSNVKLDIGGDGDFDYSDSGDLTITKNISNETLEINTFLSTCVADSNGNCDVPIIINSATTGIIQIDNINISHSYNVSDLFTQSYSSKSSIEVASNITQTEYTNFTTIKAPHSINSSGLYLNYSNSEPISCTVNGTVYSHSGGVCLFSKNLTQGQSYANYTITWDKGVLIDWLNNTAGNVVDISPEISVAASNVSYTFFFNNTDTITYNSVIVNTTKNFSTGWYNASPSYLTDDATAGVNSVTVNVSNTTSTVYLDWLDNETDVPDTAYQAKFWANGSADEATWNYFNSTLSVNNSDTINYTNVYWQVPTIITNANYTDAYGVWNGTIASLLTATPSNVSATWRANAPNSSDEIQDTGSEIWEQYTTVTCIGDSCAHYSDVWINVTVSESFTSFALYEQAGELWVLRTAAYNFTELDDTTVQWRMPTVSASTVFDVFSGSGIPPAPAGGGVGTEGGGGGAEPTITGCLLQFSPYDFSRQFTTEEPIYITTSVKNIGNQTCKGQFVLGYEDPNIRQWVSLSESGFTLLPGEIMLNFTAEIVIPSAAPIADYQFQVCGETSNGFEGDCMNVVIKESFVPDWWWVVLIIVGVGIWGLYLARRRR